MVDLHCHILFGIDDGPGTIEESLAMAEDAIADGITHIVATPHSSSDFFFDFQNVRGIRQALADKIGDRLVLATGCDFHLNPENLRALRQDPAPFCINQKDYLLVEFNEFAIPPAMDQTLHDLQLQNLRPIITHPERNHIIRTQPDRFHNWINAGCFAQITAGSLAGVFGPIASERAWHWIGQGLVHFIASDAHNTGRRPLKLKFAYDDVKSRFGEDKARALLIDNPQAAFEGIPLPHVPEVQTSAETGKRKRFFFF